MGVELHIRTSKSATWPVVAEQLHILGERPVIRMIDNLPAFPDEVPADDWADLRIGLSGGMITLRRTATGYTCVTWGNAGDSELRSLKALAFAVATTSDGTVVTLEGGDFADPCFKML